MDNENIACTAMDTCGNGVETRNKTNQKEHCDLTTCGKLVSPKLHGSKWCPISDPTPSTCAFLLKVKNCCNTRSCQLAAKICDLYAPLYEIEEPFSRGDPKYHYLLRDADIQATPSEAALEVEPIIEEKPPQPIITNEEPPSEPIMKEEEEIVEELVKVVEADVEPPPLQKISEEHLPGLSASVVENVQVPLDEDFNFAQSRNTRTSVVSWDVRASKAIKPNDSHEQIIKAINRAKEEANQFRMRGADHAVAFRKNLFAQPKESKEQIPSEEVSEEFTSSQLESVCVHDSSHNPKCCAGFRRKSRKKKKHDQEFCRERDDGSVIWPASEDPEKRKSKLSNTPVHEKKQRINKMLSKM
ncbi:unnamed protein product [Ceutorhynchus assimilis]|uniref:Uncharacterized protein n=1 Tax=Ceutorhynchus assimilis TaxID=467358 RepID=A0A9N9MDL4_9CUCU|nr:unnamed protein product [Ceutorhynchus assimilis]